MAGVAQERGVPRAQVALAWVLEKTTVVAPIVGPTKSSHIEDAVAAADIVLSAEEIEWLEESYRAHSVLGLE